VNEGEWGPYRAGWREEKWQRLDQLEEPSLFPGTVPERPRLDEFEFAQKSGMGSG
jgi:hypothetical protein